MVAQAKSEPPSSGRAPSDRAWVLLSYRIPREPSTPRIAVWRKLKELGVAQLGDGLVALPLNDRTREQLDWVAAQVMEADGTAMVWEASPTRRQDGASIAEQMRTARTQEYEALLTEVAAESAAGVPSVSRTVARWRRAWRRIDRRDHLRSPGRETARQAIADAASAFETVDQVVPAGSR